jgi:hypothetical protein
MNRLLYPATVNVSWKRNYVDPRMSVPKTWRDVYRYDPQGSGIGWTRYDGERATEFNADGLVVIDKDARGRCVKGRAVRYQQEVPKGPQHGPNYNQMKWTTTADVVSYEYAGNGDSKGHITKRERDTGGNM